MEVDVRRGAGEGFVAAGEDLVAEEGFAAPEAATEDEGAPQARLTGVRSVVPAEGVFARSVEGVREPRRVFAGEVAEGIRDDRFAAGVDGREEEVVGTGGARVREVVEAVETTEGERRRASEGLMMEEVPGRGERRVEEGAEAAGARAEVEEDEAIESREWEGDMKAAWGRGGLAACSDVRVEEEREVVERRRPLSESVGVEASEGVRDRVGEVAVLDTR